MRVACSPLTAPCARLQVLKKLAQQGGAAPKAPPKGSIGISRPPPAPPAPAVPAKKEDPGKWVLGLVRVFKGYNDP
jgi:hypothetical protein